MHAIHPRAEGDPPGQILPERLQVTGLRPLQLDLDRVRVAGLAHTDEATLLAAGGLHAGQPMTNLDIDSARRAISSMPWIDTVAIDRHWPGTVTVTVVERRAVAARLTVAPRGATRSRSRPRARSAG